MNKFSLKFTQISFAKPVCKVTPMTRSSRPSNQTLIPPPMLVSPFSLRMKNADKESISKCRGQYHNITNVNSSKQVVLTKFSSKVHHVSL